ncbi:5'-methylthioadenosine/S-adenosylhomocysteine nucleosidase [Alkalicoccus daliensis]|uniref:5'-methylthioadenosine/S-adenosylhomocysteine nucleosidase n=1 Tax=Alkalicoccus daliensis TaxID=745820 RepID=A0A1H0BHY6_9BACI|nr:5'-methylthioadenosine/S-adenosylhomocysteine nucleosidase [Alkalicoccus daliensis]SDN45256.1 methylthioadenosine nucleosidase [Alkalicoccus daliensis]
MRIGIIGAMEEEVDLLKKEMKDPAETFVAGCEFCEGRLQGVDVIVVKSGIGKVNAAVSTTLLNQLFYPDYVINTGSAGGFHNELEVGNIVVSNQVRYNDVDATVFGYEFGQVPRMPAFYEPDSLLMQSALDCAEEIGIPSVEGLIVSGDSFIGSEVQVDVIRNRFKEPYASEMEAGAIAQVCYQFQAPFVIIRALSDIAGQDSKVSYDQFLETASVNSANMVLLMLEDLRRKG